MLSQDIYALMLSQDVYALLLLSLDVYTLMYPLMLILLVVSWCCPMMWILGVNP